MAGEVSCVVLLSGGQDSSTLLGLAKRNFDRVAALSVDYAQRHKRELHSARQISGFYNVPHEVLDISNINSLLQGSALTSEDIDVPFGHYADETMKITVVPARNTILLSIAAGWAISIGYTHVSYAAHLGDFSVYPDCRPVYVQAVQQVFNVFHYWPIALWAPFLDIDKKGILDIGLKLGVPYELSWTCYVGSDRPCLKCGSCLERSESFWKSGVKDPLLSDAEWLEVVTRLQGMEEDGLNEKA